MDKNQFKPVPLNLKAELNQAMKRSGFKKAWNASEEEYSALAELLTTRKKAGLTQEKIVARMGTTKNAESRLESSIRSESHSPHFANMPMLAASDS